MPRNRSDDTSPGDARQPYSDSGGPAARHAETHDVRQEELTNPKGPEPRDTSFDDDLAPVDAPGDPAGHADESAPAADDKHVQQRLVDLLVVRQHRGVDVSVAEHLPRSLALGTLVVQAAVGDQLRRQACQFRTHVRAQRVHLHRPLISLCAGSLADR